MIDDINSLIYFFDSSLKNFDLSESFKAVRSRLPVIANALQTCKNEFDLVKDSLPADFYESIEPILRDCEDKAEKMGRIFCSIGSGASHTWEKRYSKIIRKFDVMSKIEALMKSITENVQSIFNAHAVLRVSEQNVNLNMVVSEMESLMAFSFQRPRGIILGYAPFLRSDFFVGRSDEIATLASALDLSVSTSDRKQVVLGGVPGVGKTQLALFYASGRSRGYETVYWLNATSESLLRQSYQSLASLIFRDAFEEHAVIKLVHDWLSDARNTRWLLIFDGYNDRNQFNIEDYYPPASHGAIIVTTRRPEVVKGTVIHVQPLQRLEDSLSILQNRSERENVHSNPHARLLADQLAGLPLDLTIAGCYLRSKPMSFEAYLQRYEKCQNCNANPRRPVDLGGEY